MSERLLLEQVGAGRPPAELPRAGTLVLGSSKERAGFVLSGAGVSELHAAIGRAKGGGWAIRDLGSDAGTKINGRRIEAAKLGAGDRIELGAIVLRVFDPADPGAAVRAAPAGSDTAPVELVDTPPRGMAPVAAIEAPAPNLPVIPGYRLEKRVGRGGMGEVYLALQERLARPVAIKALSRRLAADEQFVRRFEAEARAAAALNHPNVVTVYDVGEHAGVHYLSMEYMDRGTLEDRVQAEGCLPWKAVLDILRDAASGLAYAELRGIVHRDLKPANLMQNHAGATKIADLGLATHVEAEEKESAEKKVFGTAHFMAPEQARGEKVDHRSDLYSLGATAYRLLTGHTPYEGASSRDILRALLREEPRPISAFAPDVPANVTALIEKLMRKDPAQRPASAAAFLKELELVRAGPAPRPAAAAPAGARSSAGKLVALLLVLALGGGAVFLLTRPAQGPPQEPLARRDPPSEAPPVAPPELAGDPAQPLVPPAPPAQPKPPVQEGGDERELELFESKARIALLELLGRELSPQERAGALRAMSEKYRGTTAATEASERVVALEQDLANLSAATSAHHAAVLTLAQRLREAAALDQLPPSPGRSFLAMRAVEGQDAYANDALFLAERTRLEQEVVSRAAEHAKTVLEETQKDLERGDHDSVKQKLTLLMPLFDLPEFPLGHAPAGTETLFELGRRARERLANLGLIATQIQTQQARDEALALAQGLAGAEGLERELGTLDLAAARARVAALAARASSPSTKLLLGELEGELEGAGRALELLAREFQAGWRRKGVDDPRDRGEALRNAVGADAEGLLLEGQAGAVERVPWSAFGRNSKVLARLFVERLAREYTPEECRDVLALLHLSAVAEALELAGKMFDPAKKANFTEGNARELAECFAPAQAWAPKAARPPELFARDVAAAQVLARVLVDTTEGSWSAAVAGTERLLGEYQDTLVVRLLSDGTLGGGEPRK